MTNDLSSLAWAEEEEDGSVAGPGKEAAEKDAEQAYWRLWLVVVVGSLECEWFRLFDGEGRVGR